MTTSQQPLKFETRSLTKAGLLLISARYIVLRQGVVRLSKSYLHMARYHPDRYLTFGARNVLQLGHFLLKKRSTIPTLNSTRYHPSAIGALKPDGTIIKSIFLRYNATPKTR